MVEIKMTAWINPPSQADSFSASQQISLKVHYRVYNSLPYIPAVGQIYPVCAFSFFIFNNHFNILSSSTYS
jgi:hypothetical protein